MIFTLPGLESLRAALEDEDDDLTNAELDRFLCYLVGIDSRIDRLVGNGLYRLKNGDHCMKFGYSSLGDYALGRLGIQSRRAQEMVCLETWVRDYPCIDQAWRLGQLSASHVDLLRKARIPMELDADWAMQASRFTVRGLEAHLRQGGTVEVADTGEETHWTWLEVEASPEMRMRWQVACELFQRIVGRTGQPWEVLEACAAELTSMPGLNRPPSVAFRALIDSLPDTVDILKHRQDCRKAWRDHLAALEVRDSNVRLRGAYPLPDFTLPDDADPTTIDQYMRDALSCRDHQELLMRLLAQAHSRNLHLAWGLRTFHAYTQDRLGLPKSTVDRWLHVQYRLWVTPSIDTEWQAHRLNMTQTDLLLDVVNERTAPAWLEYANSVALLQLKQDVAQARILQREFPGQDVLPPTREEAVPMDISVADLLQTKESNSDGESDSSCSLLTDDPEPERETAPTCSPRPLRVGAAPLTLPGLSDGVIRMRLPIDVLVYVMHYTRGHLATYKSDITMSETFEYMVEAFLDEYLPVAKAAAKAHPVCERDHWRCQVPGCSRSANNEVHHIRYRSRGGSDEEFNLVTLCAGHHRQGIHNGYVLLSGQAPNNLVWKLGLRPDGTAYETYIGKHHAAWLSKPACAIGTLQV